MFTGRHRATLSANMKLIRLKIDIYPNTKSVIFFNFHTIFIKIILCLIQLGIFPRAYSKRFYLIKIIASEFINIKWCPWTCPRVGLNGVVNYFSAIMQYRHRKIIEVSFSCKNDYQTTPEVEVQNKKPWQQHDGDSVDKIAVPMCNILTIQTSQPIMGANSYPPSLDSLE